MQPLYSQRLVHRLSGLLVRAKALPAYVRTGLPLKPACNFACTLLVVFLVCMAVDDALKERLGAVDLCVLAYEKRGLKQIFVYVVGRLATPSVPVARPL